MVGAFEFCEAELYRRLVFKRFEELVFLCEVHLLDLDVNFPAKQLYLEVLLLGSAKSVGGHYL